MKNKESIVSLQDLPRVVAEIQASLSSNIIFLQGDLGAGKTTFVAEFLKLYGIKGVVSSPTFTYLQVYKGDGGKVFYHFDLYRLKRQEDFFASGFDEYLENREALIFVEWPEILMSLFPGACCVKIAYKDEQSRTVSWSC